MDSVGIQAGKEVRSGSFPSRRRLISFFRSSRAFSTNSIPAPSPPVSSSPLLSTSTRADKSSSCRAEHLACLTLDSARPRISTPAASTAWRLCADRHFFSWPPKSQIALVRPRALRHPTEYLCTHLFKVLLG